MQGNFKYPRIKKIRQKIVKITRIDHKDQKSIVSCYHMNCCLQKYTTHQFTYFIYYLFQDKFKYPKMMSIQQVHQKLQAKQLLGCLQPSLISLFYFLFLSNQIALFFLENRIHLGTPLQKSYC